VDQTFTQAVTAGARVVKFFPAEPLGGLPMLKALAAPFTQARFIPTGGITSTNLSSYLQLPVVAAIGGSWMVDKALVNAGKWQEISDLTRQALASAAACSRASS
jgi:2-dehydro-3-deoxyphosphogluconate aldolase/(4S)-4-hydroxy-2-oxoglutarate aldolase